MPDIQKFSAEEQNKAKDLLSLVDGLLDSAREGRNALARTYVEIGVALVEVENSRAWMVTDKRTFDGYIMSCEERFGRSRTSLYGYKSVAEQLLPVVSKDKLIQMGVSRAMPLAQYAKHKIGKLPEALIAKALDPKITAESFEAMVNEKTHSLPEPGDWHQIGIKADKGEWAEIERAMTLALGEMPEKVSQPTKNKIALLNMAREYIGTWGPQAVRTETV